MRAKKTFILLAFVALLIVAMHPVSAQGSTKTAYIVLQVYNIKSTSDYKVFTMVAANNQNAMTLTITLLSPRTLTTLSPYVVTVQPGNVTMVYSGTKKPYYLDAIIMSNSVIFFTSHEIYWGQTGPNWWIFMLGIIALSLLVFFIETFAFILSERYEKENKPK